MLDIDDVAAQLKISTSTVRRLVRDGLLKAYRVGGQLRFKQEDIGQYLDSQLIQPKNQSDKENSED